MRLKIGGATGGSFRLMLGGGPCTRAAEGVTATQTCTRQLNHGINSFDLEEAIEHIEDETDTGDGATHTPHALARQRTPAECFWHVSRREPFFTSARAGGELQAMLEVQKLRAEAAKPKRSKSAFGRKKENSSGDGLKVGTDRV